MNKSPDAFRTISEVAEDLDLPQHVLRFWETRFKEIKPLKRGGGRRYYRPEDVDLLRGIKHLLYDEGYTIRGLQRILKEQGNRFVVAVGKGEIAADSVGDLPPARAVGLVHPGEEDEPYIDEGDEEADSEAGVEPEEGWAQPHSQQQARTVAEIAQAARPRGILDRLMPREPAPPLQASTQGGLGPDERRRLQATLYELLECKRLLDQVRGN